RAAAEEFRSRAGHTFGSGKSLLARFNGAWSCDDGDFASADAGVSSRKVHHRLLVFYLATDQLVGLAYMNNFLHARHFVERAGFNVGVIAGDADSGAGCTRHGMGTQPEPLNLVANRAYLFLGSSGFHYDKHGNPLVRFSVPFLTLGEQR